MWFIPVPKIWTDMGVSEKIGVPRTPKNHPNFTGIFHDINHLAIGVPPWLWNPPYNLYKPWFPEIGVPHIIPHLAIGDTSYGNPHRTLVECPRDLVLAGPVLATGFPEGAAGSRPGLDDCHGLKSASGPLWSYGNQLVFQLLETCYVNLLLETMESTIYLMDISWSWHSMAM